MATYTELVALKGTPDYDTLKNKIAVAITIKAKAIGDSATPTAAQITWAKEALVNPVQKAEQIINYVLAANIGATIEQINAANDAAIQTNVNNAVDKILSL
jgi:hypothetical protein